MAINKKLIHFKTRAAFEIQLAENNILDTSIVFIKDSNLIWTHGTYYCLPNDEVIITDGTEPTNGQEIWIDTSEDSTLYAIEDAPKDGNIYARQNGVWVPVAADLSNYLAKDNTTAFTPSGNYNPATKKYVDGLTDIITKDIIIEGYAGGTKTINLYDYFPGTYTFGPIRTIGGYTGTNYVRIDNASSVTNINITLLSDHTTNIIKTPPRSIITTVTIDGVSYPIIIDIIALLTHRILTEAQYNALGNTPNTDGILYFVTPN